MIWLRKAFLMHIEKDRVLFYYFTCAHYNRMSPWHVYHNVCHWQLVIQMGKLLICVTASMSICSTNTFPNRPKTQAVLTEGHHDPMSVCYTKKKITKHPCSCSGNESTKGTNKESLLAISRQHAYNMTQALERVFYHETLLHTSAITSVRLFQLCKQFNL